MGIIAKGKWIFYLFAISWAVERLGKNS